MFLWSDREVLNMYYDGYYQDCIDNGEYKDDDELITLCTLRDEEWEDAMNEQYMEEQYER